MPKKTVHLAFKTHLDLGFTDYAATVSRHYFHHFIPAALDLAQRVREAGQGHRFIWTTGSWLIYTMLEITEGRERRRLEDAVNAGDIAWHALPFTFHTELCPPSLFRFGLSLSQTLDRRFGKTTVAAKMTDVPGHTRSMLPYLAEAGVRFLHIGVNPASPPPSVPPVFLWKHPDGAELVVAYGNDYGNEVAVPDDSLILQVCHTNDNMGPPSAEAVAASFERAQTVHPEATIEAATLNPFGRAVWEQRNNLPVIDDEIGDTWIHGAGTDPEKVRRFRALCRIASVTPEFQATDDPAIHAFYRTLLCVPEHTWGLDEKTHLKDYSRYRRDDFQTALADDPAFARFAASWQEQRDYLDQAVNLLPDKLKPLCHQAMTAKNQNDDEGFSASGEPVIAFAGMTLGFCPRYGVLHEWRGPDGSEWASPDYPQGRVRYQTFSADDYDRYNACYNVNLDKPAIAKWAIPDFSKPGLREHGDSTSGFFEPTLVEQRLAQTDDTLAVRLVLQGPAEAVNRWGCPGQFVLDWTFFAKEPGRARLRLVWRDKPANRQPEALWLSFQPPLAGRGTWQFLKMGYPIDPRCVVPRGNRTLHAVDPGVRCSDGQQTFALDTPDAPLVAPGEPGLLTFPSETADLRGGVHVNLYNNVWGTNFPMWYNEDACFRFEINPS